MVGPAVPTATYRIQLRPGFGFAEVARLAPYLRALGVSHLYLSPVMEAVSNSQHGYDVVDPTRVREELGGPEGFSELCSALGKAGIAQIIDIVPNHMAIGVPENRWWWDVLENGPSSLYASYFDVDWDRGPHNRIQLPMLAERYGDMVRQARLHPRLVSGAFLLRHESWELPLAPPSVADVVAAAASDLEEAAAVELSAIATALARLSPSWVTDTDAVRERHLAKDRLRGRLAGLCNQHPAVTEAIEARLESIREDPAELDRLLEAQNYRLSHWRSASDELDYRRFFDIGTLIGVRVEDELVFADSHSLVLEWLGSGRIDGVRIDHVDGLADPTTYLHRLREAGERAWVVVEKILGPGEALPEQWPVSGTTGYEVAAAITRVFIDPAGEEPLSNLWAEISGDDRDFEAYAHVAKHEVLGAALRPDLSRVARRLADLARSELRWRDYTFAELSKACEEVLACLGIYRTYVPSHGDASERDTARIDAALGEAARRLAGADDGTWELIRCVALGREPFSGERGSEVRRRFQQLSGAVAAKAVEDCAFYRHSRLVALNEVGADPGSFGLDLGSFHAAASAWQRWPFAMVCSSTHDTKRSEDVRARIGVLSEAAGPWASTTRRWLSSLTRHWRGADADPGMQYLFLQSLVGVFSPLQSGGEYRSELASRLSAYMLKAAREAKLRTSWIDQDASYEAALESYVAECLWDEAFMADCAGLVASCLGEAGWLTSLGMTAAKMSLPGVPDTYQGCEVWDDSLVDPDNRRAVDFAARQALLESLGEQSLGQLWEDPETLASGAPKLAVISRLASLRKRRADCFGDSAQYLPVRAVGDGAQNLLCYARVGSGPGRIVVVLPRLVLSALSRSEAYVEGIDGWPSMRIGTMARAVAQSLASTVIDIPGGQYRDVLSNRMIEGGRVEASGVWGEFPMCVLEAIP